MAHKVFCPHCGKVTECQKRGKTKGGKQRWTCKNCQKTFTEQKRQVRKDTVETRTTNTGSGKRTEIYLNNNLISTVEKELTIDEAKEVLKLYATPSEVNIKTTRDGDTVKVYFEANMGTKG